MGRARLCCENERFWFAEKLRVQYISSMRVGSTEAGLLTTASIRRPHGDGDERARSESQGLALQACRCAHAILCAEGRAPHAHIRGRVFSHVQRSGTPPGKNIIDYCNMVLGNEDAYIRDLQYGVRGTGYGVQRRGRQGLDSIYVNRLCYPGGTGAPWYPGRISLTFWRCWSILSAEPELCSSSRSGEISFNPRLAPNE